MILDKDSLNDRVTEHLLTSVDVKRQVAETCVDSILAAAGLIADTFRSGGKILLCGNGGSAADCQHMATEFVNQLTNRLERPALPAIALTTDTSFLTAYANDVGFDGVFERQVQALGRPGDVLIGISTSGSSVNVIRAFEVAAASAVHTVALTGSTGPMKDMATVAITVPCTNTQYVQESHLAIEHVLCDLVERYLYGNDGYPESA